MKNKISLLCSILYFSFQTLYSQPHVGDFGPQPIDEAMENAPFYIQVYGDSVIKSKLSGKPYAFGDLTYSEVEATLNYIFYHNPCEGLYATAGYDVSNLDWNDNLFFRKKRFDTAIFALGAYTGRFSNWFWNTNASINIDTDHFNCNDYTTYDAMLWGRYAFREDIGLHIGVLALLGMDIHHIYPIIGFDWAFQKNWVLNVVFPTNISLNYLYNCTWSFELAGRFWDSRHRVGKNEPLRKGLFNYRNYGAEFAIHYDSGCVSANLHGGYTFAGSLTVANEDYKNRRRIDLDPAPYFGGEFLMHF